MDLKNNNNNYQKQWKSNYIWYGNNIVKETKITNSWGPWGGLLILHAPMTAFDIGFSPLIDDDHGYKCFD